MRKNLLILLLMAFILSSCNLPGVPDKIVENLPGNNNWITINSDGAPTPTPFLPIELDPSLPLPTSMAQQPPIDLPTGLPNRPDGQVNILIMGSDFRPGQGYRTDVFMLLSLYPKQGTASVISFPRDLWVYIPGIGDQRINVAQPYGGFELSKSMLEENFNVTADYYIMTNFQGFKSIVDSLGGINVIAAQNLSDHCDLPQSDGQRNCHAYTGSNYMNGETALWYVRSRYSSSDLDRTRRAQEVILALFDKLMSLNAVSRVPELYSIYINSVETDLTVEAVIPLLSLASQLISDPSKIRRYAIGSEQVTPYIMPDSGANVLLPNYEAIKILINNSAFTP